MGANSKLYALGLSGEPSNTYANATSLSPATSPSLLYYCGNEFSRLPLFFPPPSYVRSECNHIVESQQDATLHPLQGAHRSSQLPTSTRHQATTKNSRSSEATTQQYHARRVHHHDSFRWHNLQTSIDEMCRCHRKRGDRREAPSPPRGLHRNNTRSKPYSDSFHFQREATEPT